MYEQLAKGAYNKWNNGKELSLIPLAWTFVSGAISMVLIVAWLVLVLIGFFAGSLSSMEMGIIAAIIVSVPSGIAAALAFMYASAIYGASLYTMADATLSGKKMQMEKAVFGSKPLWGKFFKFSLLQALIILIAIAVSGIPLAACAVISAFYQDMWLPLLILGGLVSFLALVVLALYLTALFFFSSPILLYEKGGTIAMLSKCRALLHKKPKHVILSLLVVWAVSMALGILLTMLLLPIYAIALFFGPIQYVATMIQSVVNAVVLVPWVTLFQLSAYKKK